MAGSAFKDPEVIQALANFTPILVDGATEKDITGRYKVNGFPNTIFADVKGEPAGPAIVGAMPTDQFLQRAQDFAKKIRKGVVYERVFSAGPAVRKSIFVPKYVVHLPPSPTSIRCFLPSFQLWTYAAAAVPLELPIVPVISAIWFR